MRTLHIIVGENHVLNCFEIFCELLYLIVSHVYIEWANALVPPTPLVWGEACAGEMLAPMLRG